MKMIVAMVEKPWVVFFLNNKYVCTFVLINSSHNYECQIIFILMSSLPPKMKASLIIIKIYHLKKRII